MSDTRARRWFIAAASISMMAIALLTTVGIMAHPKPGGKVNLDTPNQFEVYRIGDICIEWARDGASNQRVIVYNAHASTRTYFFHLLPTKGLDGKDQWEAATETASGEEPYHAVDMRQLQPGMAYWRGYGERKYQTLFPDQANGGN